MQPLATNQQVSPNYTFILPFERDFQPADAGAWLVRNRRLPFYAAAIYLVAIFAGQALMANRPAFKLKRPLTLWNICLALFSIIGTSRTLPELVHVLRHFGFDQSVCNLAFIEQVRPSGFWSFAFTLSKIPELGDTAFIVLRKQNLQVLHWYHHVTVLLFTWFAWIDDNTHMAAGRWFIDMNYLVHSLMYSYYALKSLGLRIPKQVAMLVTTAQILQMLLGAYVICHASYRKWQGHSCSITQATALSGLIMYLSYFFLFAKFFHNAYFAGPREKAHSRTGGSRKEAKSVGAKRD